MNTPPLNKPPLPRSAGPQSAAPQNPAFQRLERLVSDALRTQPLRRAPATLEARVLHAVARAGLPWWRKGFVYWPLTARVAFLVASIGAVRFTLSCVTRAFNWLAGSVVSSSLAAMAPDFTWVRVVSSLYASFVDSVPALWVYGGLAVIAFMYVSLFSLGAAAYRTLYANR